MKRDELNTKAERALEELAEELPTQLDF